tara:strand:- start:61 stop:585 length:525 start_codon:yes stop_codon:yes gene_type:complete
MKYIDRVILEKDLYKLYTGLINSNVWNLSRSSKGEEIGTFPGFVVKDNFNEVSNDYWNGYFTSLYERINTKFFEKYNYELSNNIYRIHLGAKNETSITNFHTDMDESDYTTVLGFLTPTWVKDWGGQLQVEEETIDFTPGKFLIFKSNKVHDGVGPNKKIPYWRISINYIIKNG